MAYGFDGPFSQAGCPASAGRRRFDSDHPLSPEDQAGVEAALDVLPDSNPADVGTTRRLATGTLYGSPCEPSMTMSNRQHSLRPAPSSESQSALQDARSGKTAKSARIGESCGGGVDWQNMAADRSRPQRCIAGSRARKPPKTLGILTPGGTAWQRLAERKRAR